MCGVFLLDKKSELTDSNKIKAKKSVQLLDHRGPDNSEIFFTKNLAIGHTRLSILDLNKRSNQPFHNEYHDTYLSINGEIINYKELAEKYNLNLNECGSDCKVVFKLFNDYGVKNIINELEGMFSGIYVNARKNISIIFRDRFGIKPLYYTKNKNYFLAASEINAILPFLNKANQNLKIVRDFIIDGNIDHTNNTFFENIFQLPAGCLMEIDISNNQIDTHRWFKEDFLTGFSEIKYDDAKYQLKNTLEKLVMQNYISDVPVAINLSEGVDSTLLASIAESIGKKPKCYSLKFGLGELEDFYNLQNSSFERKFVEFDTELFLIYLKDVIRSQSQPFTGMFTVAFSHFYEISRNNGNKVHLDGNGLDEFFLGYDKYLNTDSFHLGQDLSGQIYNNFDFFSNELISCPSAQKLLDVLSKFPSELDIERKLSLADLFYLKMPRALRFNDHISMHHSCELRVPFLDHRLLKFALTLPKNFLINNNRKIGKFLIRDILSEYSGPKFSLSNKRYIQTPQTEMLFGDLKNLLKNTLCTDRFYSRNIVDPKKFKNYLDKVDPSRIKNSYHIWRLLSYEWWCQQFLD